MIVEMSGSEFRNVRKRLKLRQDELAALLNRTRQHISRLESKKTIPSVYALAIRQLEAIKTDAAA